MQTIMNRFHRSAFAFLFLALASAPLRAGTEAGQIEIGGQPGAQVLLDGLPKGTIPADDASLRLGQIPAGEHRLKIARQGFQSPEISILLGPGSTARYVVKSEKGKFVIESAGESKIAAQTGALLVQTLPLNCTITIPGLKLEAQRKAKDEWRVNDVPSGDYPCTLEALGKVLRADIPIRPGVTTALYADFLQGKVENRSVWFSKASQKPEAEPQASPIGAVEGSSDHPVTPEELVAEAESNCAAIKGAIKQLDAELGGGGLGLQATEKLKLRADWSRLLEAAEENRRKAADDLDHCRQDCFEKDYAAFREIAEASPGLPSPLRSTIVASAWHDLVQRWAVAGTGESPVPLFWAYGKVWVQSKPIPGSPIQIPELRLRLVWIPPGKFMLGSPAEEPGKDADEQPQTAVTLTRGFWLGKSEVTQGEWQAIMGNNPSHFTGAGERAPVEQISWEDAMEFCRRITDRERQAGRLPDGYCYTLPTEAQWEYACRAGSAEADADTLASRAWFGADSGNTPHPVAQKKPSLLGLYDMQGNVWEWCLDWKGDYPGGRVVDYYGPAVGSLRIFRGGAWADPELGCRIALRCGGDPSSRSDKIGFRLCLGPEPTTSPRSDKKGDPGMESP